MRTEHIQQLVQTAETCVAEGSFHKATHYFYRALELSMPGEFTAELALLRLSHLYQIQGNHDLALELIEQAIELRPSESKYHLIRAEILLMERRFDEALAASYEAMQDPMNQQMGLVLAQKIAIEKSDQRAADNLSVLIRKLTHTTSS